MPISLSALRPPCDGSGLYVDTLLKVWNGSTGCWLLKEVPQRPGICASPGRFCQYYGAHR